LIAFKLKSINSIMAFWYTFTTIGGADPLDPANYSSPQNNQPSCPGNNKICAILADDNGFNHPVITNAVEDDIIRALQLGSDQTSGVLRF